MFHWLRALAAQSWRLEFWPQSLFTKPVPCLLFPHLWRGQRQDCWDLLTSCLEKKMQTPGPRRVSTSNVKTKIDWGKLQTPSSSFCVFTQVYTPAHTYICPCTHMDTHKSKYFLKIKQCNFNSPKKHKIILHTTNLLLTTAYYLCLYNCKVLHTCLPGNQGTPLTC